MFHPPVLTYSERTWWHRGKPYTLPELVLDGVVHSVGLLIALGVGGVLLLTGAAARPVLLVYIASLLLVLTVSLAFNLAPVAH